LSKRALGARVDRLPRLTRREQLVVLEIGGDVIDSASAFVAYMSEIYGFSKSSVWYNLNRLKEKGVVDFATKEEPGKSLILTNAGEKRLSALAKAGIKLDELEEGVQDFAPAAASHARVAFNAWD
jgi:hypothetical protein